MKYTIMEIYNKQDSYTIGMLAIVDTLCMHVQTNAQWELLWENQSPRVLSRIPIERNCSSDTLELLNGGDWLLAYSSRVDSHTSSHTLRRV